MASPINQHCANCIGTLSFPITNNKTLQRVTFANVPNSCHNMISECSQQAKKSDSLIYDTVGEINVKKLK